jgi:hypothetical protein
LLSAASRRLARKLATQAEFWMGIAGPLTTRCWGSASASRRCSVGPSPSVATP